MSLFSKTEVNQKMLPFIENGEGVGVVKVNGYGKASARMESYKIIFDSYEGKNSIIESVSAITYLSYKKGNFISEPKLEIGISHKKYILAGVDNNDDELETFYRTILDVKNLEKQQKKSSHMGITKPVTGTEDELVEIESLIEDENIDLEEEVLNEIPGEDAVDTRDEEPNNESENLLGKIVEEDSEDDFEVLEELDEEEIDIAEESIENEVQETEEKEEKIENEADELEDLDIDDDSDELIIELEGESTVDNYDEPIVEEFDEELDDEFNDEMVDNEVDSGRIIMDSENKTQNETNDDLTINEQESEKNIINSEDKEEDIVEEVQEIKNVAEDTSITTDNVTSEIGKMKQQLYSGINGIHNELNSENQIGFQVPSYMQPDPVDQIRRYYELKEDGIITEEEFELKKKQLLDL
ncbi:MAG: SHOCT domain-containing protein [Methanosphaera stadtmanae]|nr:SHOCT domain-containing protein [Methanosphaera stadtmanae]